MDLRYPIGRPQLPEEVTMNDIQAWIDDIQAAPDLLQRAVAGLTDEQLDTPYRPDGWTVRQVVHHLADTHLSTYLNFRLGLTQDTPNIAVNDVDASAELTDAKTAPIEMSLSLFQSLHQRWIALLKPLALKDYLRTVQSARGQRTLASLLGVYAWHGKHHVAHIEALRKRMGW